jgi:hypothetical protein
MDPKEWLFDKRVIRRNLEKGVLTWKSYKEYMKSTSNLENEYELIDLDAKDDQEADDPEAADPEADDPEAEEAAEEIAEK